MTVSAEAPWATRFKSNAWRASASMWELSFDALPSTPRPTGLPARRSASAGAMPEPSRMLEVGQCAIPTRARSQAGNLAAVEMDAVRNPGALVEPPAVPEKIQRPLAELSQAVILFVLGLGEVGVQADAVTLGQLGRRAHQPGGDGKRRARRQRDPQHRSGRGIVIFLDQPLAIVENLLFALDHRIGRQPSLALANAHAAARGMEADADAAGGCDFGVDQPVWPRGKR